ncbi:MAG: hypothetical protein EOM73_07715 [Bacteroidia bacterium]|nr:hypothetical protein [Bacteroidia bacterium]
MTRKNILICDDQRRFIDSFVKRHRDYYNIREETDIRKLLDRIDEQKTDLVLLDLYHPNDNNPDFRIRRTVAEKELKNLTAQLEKTKEAVNAAWNPKGLGILEDIRKKHKDIPVIIYSQSGPLLLNDDQLRFVRENDGYWMQKNEDIPDKKIELDRIMNRSKEFKSVVHKYKTLLFASWTGFIFFIFLQIFKIDVLWNILFGIVGSVIAYFITKAIEK